MIITRHKEQKVVVLLVEKQCPNQQKFNKKVLIFFVDLDVLIWVVCNKKSVDFFGNFLVNSNCKNCEI